MHVSGWMNLLYEAIPDLTIPIKVNGVIPDF